MESYPQITAPCLLVSEQMLQQALQSKVLHYETPIDLCVVMGVVATEYARYYILRDMAVHSDRTLGMLESLIHRFFPIPVLSQLDAS